MPGIAGVPAWCQESPEYRVGAGRAKRQFVCDYESTYGTTADGMLVRVMGSDISRDALSIRASEWQHDSRRRGRHPYQTWTQERSLSRMFSFD